MCLPAARLPWINRPWKPTTEQLRPRGTDAPSRIQNRRCLARNSCFGSMIPYVTGHTSPEPDGSYYNGCQPEGPREPGTHNTQHTDGKICNTHLKLKRTPLFPREFRKKTGLATGTNANFGLNHLSSSIII